MEKARKNHIWGWICLVVLIIVGLGIFLNREWIYDFYRGITYQPSDEMAKIRSDLDLTDKGEFLFNAAQPELDGAAEFNSYCREGGESEIAVLGCYTNGNIYVYNIADERLNGIRELTSAHAIVLHPTSPTLGNSTAQLHPASPTSEASISLGQFHPQAPSRKPSPPASSREWR